MSYTSSGCTNATLTYPAHIKVNLIVYSTTYLLVVDLLTTLALHKIKLWSCISLSMSHLQESSLYRDRRVL